MSNFRLFILLFAIACGMLGLAFGFVPLYRMFCDALGIPVPSIMVGQAGEAKNITHVSDRTITVRFMANQAVGVPVKLHPITRKVKVRLGEDVLTAYRAQNMAPQPMDGVAVHTIFAMGGLPGTDINDYVELQQCFCFEQQYYPGNEEVTLPLSFAITPDLPAGIHTVTFAYTLFEADKANLPAKPKNIP